jgi:hypothetical protein
VEKLAEQQRARRGSNGHGGNSSSGSERSPPPKALRAESTVQAYMVCSPMKDSTHVQPVGPSLPYPFQTGLNPISQGMMPLELHHPQPVASTSAYVSPPSAVSDRIEHPASPPLPTGLTPFTNPESTLPAQLKLDAFISRDLAMKTISLFFEHVSLSFSHRVTLIGQVSCIMPLIHKPSFMADLAAGEEERNPIFFALILQMISMTLIHVSHFLSQPYTADQQLPVAYFPIPAEDVRAFSDRCMRRANAITHRNAERLSLDMCIIKYVLFLIEVGVR